VCRARPAVDFHPIAWYLGPIELPTAIRTEWADEAVRLLQGT
jgi:hypothetical protein